MRRTIPTLSLLIATACSPELDVSGRQAALLDSGDTADTADTADTGIELRGNNFLINDGDPYTSRRRVELRMHHKRGFEEVCISNTESCNPDDWRSSPENGDTRRWMLRPENGPQTVSVWWRDGGQIAGPKEQTIELDMTRPEDGVLDAVAAESQVALSWSGFVDPETEIVEYVVTYDEGSIPGSR